MIDWLHERVWNIWRFVRLVNSRFGLHQGPQNAASLAYTTLLSLVPLMTVVLAILAALPVGDRAGDVIQDFVFENFVPAAGEAIRTYLQEFSSAASRLSGIGFFFLLLVALLLMSSIDRALNTIWEVHKVRSLVNKFTVYWVILTLGPVAMVTSILATSYLITLPMFTEATSTSIGKYMFQLTPIGLSALGFTLMYLLVPNRRIRFGYALTGGIFAALLFEIAKHGFAVYVTSFNTYQAIYGALAAIPIFLVWVYLLWLIVLLGAEFTYCLEIVRRYEGTEPDSRNRLAEMIDLLRRIGHIQEQEGAASIKRLSPGHINAEALLADLQQKGFVYETDEGGWVLAKCLADVRVYDVYRAYNYRLPHEGEEGWPVNEHLATCFLDAINKLDGALNKTLNEL